MEILMDMELLLHHDLDIMDKNVFDSSSKTQSGILLGNLVEYGTFDQCVKILALTDYGEIRGKYCTIRIKPPIELIETILRIRKISKRRFIKVKSFAEHLFLSWAVCLPNSCYSEDILPHFNKTFTELGYGLDLEVFLENRDCVTEADFPKLSTIHFVIISIFITMIAIVLITGAYDWMTQGESTNQIINIFSGYSNVKKIISKSKNKDDMDCLHGIKFLTTCFVVIGHRYLSNLFFPSINSLEILDWILRYTSSFIIGGTITVETFFVISGMLVAIGFFQNMEQTRRFNLPLFYLSRFLRITIPLSIAVLIYATLMQFFGYGPLWHQTYPLFQKPCQDFWWSTLLHIQFYTNPTEFCIVQTWYLSCEMFLYFFSPLILYPLWKWPVFGYINYAVWYILSMGISFYVAWVNEFDGSVPVTNQLFKSEFFQQYYITPYTRLPAYITGLGFGFTVYRFKGHTVKLNSFLNVIFWIISLGLLITMMAVSRVFYLEDHEYNKFQSSLFLSFSRSIWALGVIWIVWSCINGHGGIVNWFLSLHIFRILSRISYGIFLFHMLLQVCSIGSARVPSYFSDFTQFYAGFGDLVIMVLFGFLFTIFYEMPLIRIAESMFKSQTRNKVKTS